METFCDIDYNNEKAEKYRLKYGRMPTQDELLFFGSGDEKEKVIEDSDD